MMRRIDLSADLGEGSASEPEIWPLITSANVACGGHAGDGDSMAEAVRRASRSGIRLGAHPSYPDREGFGRRTIAIDSDRLCVSLVEQLESLRRIAAASGVGVHHVKPHGALYNDAYNDGGLARTLLSAMQQVDPSLAIVCGDRSELAAVSRARGVKVIREAFADRRYNADGSLVSRNHPGALLSVPEAAEQVRLLAGEGVVVTVEGDRLSVPFDTICIHADLEGAVDRLLAIRQVLGST